MGITDRRLRRGDLSLRIRARWDDAGSGVPPPTASRHTIYLTSDFEERWPELVSQLGRHTSGTSCLYLTRLSNVDTSVLRRLLERTRDHTLSEWSNT